MTLELLNKIERDDDKIELEFVYSDKTCIRVYFDTLFELQETVRILGGFIVSKTKDIQSDNVVPFKSPKKWFMENENENN